MGGQVLPRSPGQVVGGHPQCCVGTGPLACPGRWLSCCVLAAGGAFFGARAQNGVLTGWASVPSGQLQVGANHTVVTVGSGLGAPGLVLLTCQKPTPTGRLMAAFVAR